MQNSDKPKSRTSELLPSLAIIGAALFWGTSWWPLRQASEAGVAPAWATLLMAALPALILIPWVIRRWREFRIGGRWVLPIALLIGGSSALYGMAVIVGDVVRVLLLFYLMPVWSALLEWLILRGRIGWLRAAMIGVGLAGLAILLGFEHGFPTPRSLSDWMGLTAGICWAAGVVLIRATEKSHPLADFVRIYAQYVGTVAAVLVIMPIAFGGFVPFPDAASFWAAAGILAIGGICWVLPTGFLGMWGVARLSPSRSGLLFIFEVPVGALSAAWLAGETMGLREIIGGALIVGATVIDVAFVRQEEKGSGAKS